MEITLENGYVYHRVSGSWVLARDRFPDIVTTFGLHEEGDYITVELLNEIRDVINLFDAYLLYGLSWVDCISASDTTGGYDGTATDATLIGARGIAEASFLANVVAIGDGFVPFFHNQAHYAGVFGPRGAYPEYVCTVAKTIARLNIPDSVLGLMPTIDSYIDGAVSPGDLDGFDFFEGNGEAVEGVLTKWDTVTGTGAGATINTDYFGTLNVPFNWGPDPIVPGNPTLPSPPNHAGYTVGAAFAIYNYNVAGGYDQRRSL